MSDIVTRTRIVPPRRRPDQLARPRLVELFEELLGHRLILLVAPAGYGKTSALVELAHYTAMPVCWYAIGALDNDTYRFFSHLIASISQRFPDFAPAATAALKALTAEQIRMEQFITTVVNELYEHATDDYLLIVDDYHLVANNDDISGFFSQFVQVMDESCHVVLSSRRLHGLPDMPLLVARGYVSGLDFEDLAFSEVEVQQLVLQNFGRALSQKEAAELVSATEGWITGLLLSEQSKLQKVPERLRRLRAAGVNLYEYLAQQVLDQEPPAQRDFLMRTAIVAEFDADLCAEIFPAEWLPADTTWAALIDDLFQRNLFAVAVGDTGEWVRYHPLFEEFLVRQLNSERPTEAALILQRLAVYFTAQQAWEKTYHCLQELHDNQGIARLIETAGNVLFQQDRTFLLETWLNALSTDLRQQHPRLLSLQGAVLARRGSPVEGLLALNEALTFLEPCGPSLGLADALVRRAIVRRMQGMIDDARVDCERALRLIENLQAGVDDDPKQWQHEHRALHALALKTYSIILDNLDHSRESIGVLEQALALYQSEHDPQNEAAILQEMGRIHMDLGEYSLAAPLYEQALLVLRRLANLSGQALTLNNLGVLHHLKGDYLAAIDALEEAHLCAERSGYARFIAYSLASLADLLADVEMWEPARNVYGRALLAANSLGERYLMLYLELALAQVATAREHWEQAFTRLDNAAAIVVGRQQGTGWARYQLAMGRYYLACDRPGDALAPLSEAEKYFAAGELRSEQASATLFFAAACAKAQKLSTGTAALARGLAVMQTLESHQSLVTALRPVKSTLASYRKQPTVAQSLSLLLAKIESFEQEMPNISRQIRQHPSAMLQALLADAPPKLLIRALGRADVILDGHPVSNRDWQTQSARDLFFGLLAHPGGLTKEQIGLLFWPDASPNELRTRFKNSIYRLRSALSEEVVRFDDNLYYFNRGFDYEYDVENFKGKLNQAQLATEATARMNAYMAALNIYRGPYLPGVDGVWAAIERENLEHRFQEAALELARLQLEAGELSAALQTSQRALERDSCREDAHRLAMQIFAAMGNRAGVVHQYERCERLLLEELGVPPSPQTTELLAQLTR